MSIKTYTIGDMVIVKAGLAKMPPASRTCKIVQVLPADHGEVQYRVRFDGEVCDRRIVATDIEAPGEVSRVGGTAAGAPTGGSWLKASRIRIGR